MKLALSKWFPVASISDLPYRHIFQGQLLGREYAIWKADDGNINIWENRCLHRGVRLSIGTNEGFELKCQYHGWRYANRTAGCTYIPAHPADAPARTICNNTYTCQEKYGMVWTCETPIGDVPDIKGFKSFTVLRPIPINSAYKNVRNFLSNKEIPDHHMLESKQTEFWRFKTNAGNLLSLVIQPQSGNISILRGIYNLKTTGTEKLRVLKYYNSLMTKLRDEIESQHLPKLHERNPKISKLADDLSQFPTLSDQKHNLRVSVSEKVKLSDNIVKLKLKSIKKQLPTFHAGAHIDIVLQNGLIRQYSLTNGPGETDHYCIAVKIEKHGGGGSKIISENISVGDIMAISAPHNSFPLLRNSTHIIFLAGGIGITPMLSMAKAMHSMRQSFELHHFTKSNDKEAFSHDFASFTNKVITYNDLSINQSLTTIKSLLKKPKFSNKIYVCGPGEMIQNAIKIGLEFGWNESDIHYEYFKNENEIHKNSTFKIDLARSAMSLEVPSGKSVLQILKENGVNLVSSCEQGACGTCKVRVIEGEIDHQDVFLNSLEKEGQNIMLTCVSRAKSKRLILDI